MHRHVRWLLLALLLAVMGAGSAVWRERRQEGLDRALIAAVLRNDTDAAVRALDAGANANARVSDPKMPAPSWWQGLWARARGIKPPEDTRDTALLAALDSLVKRPGVGENQTPPHNLALVRALLDHGASANVRNQIRSTPLLEACAWDHGDTAALLIERGADVNAAMDGGMTPLMTAAPYGNVAVVTELLTHGARPNDRDILGDTALHEAMYCPWAEATTRALLQYGADPNLRDNAGVSPLMMAKRTGHADLVAIMKPAGSGAGRDTTRAGAHKAASNLDTARQ